MTATTRVAVSGDLAAIALFMDAASLEMRPQRGGEALLSVLRRGRSSFALLEEALNDHDAVLWCGLWDEVVVGYAIAWFSASDAVVTLTDIYTEPDVRDVGVGEALLETAIAWAIERHAVAIDAQTLPGARESKNLFERFGLTARLITVRREL